MLAVDDIINRLLPFIHDEMRMPAGMIKDVIEEIERLRADRNRWRELANDFADAGTHDTAHSLVMDDYLAWQEARRG